MQTVLNILGRFTGFITAVLTGVGFFLLIKQMKKSNRLRSFSHLLSIIFSLLMLLVNIFFLQKAHINLWSVFALIFGAGFGFAWGTTTKLHFENDRIMGKRSVLYIYFWLASMVFTQLLAIFAKTNSVAIGLAGMFFSAGASLGTNSNILFRIRRLYQSIPAVAGQTHPENQVDTGVSYCPKCGNPVSSEDIYCGVCGTRLSKEFEEKPQHSPKYFEEPKKPPKKRGFFGKFLVAAGLIISPFAIGFILIRFVFADQIFPMNLKIGNSEITLKLPNAEEPVAQVAENKPLTTNTDTPKLNLENAQVVQETPTQEQPLITYFEDFNSSYGKFFSFLSEKYVTLRRSEGLFVIESTSYPGDLPALVKDIVLSNMVVEFDFMMPDAFQDSRAGFIYHVDTDYSDGLDNLCAIVLTPSTNQIRLNVWNQSQNEFTGNPVELDLPFKDNYEFNHVILEISGQDVLVTINNNPSYLLTGCSLEQPGLVGLFLSASSEVEQGDLDYVIFDNFQLSEIP